MSEYVIERTVSDRPLVYDNLGKLLELRPKDVLPGIEIFGQHELSELARNQSKLTALLKRFEEPDEELSRKKIELSRDLQKSQRSLLGIATELEDVDESMAALPALEEALQRYRAAGLEKRLLERSLLEREERLMDQGGRKDE